MTMEAHAFIFIAQTINQMVQKRQLLQENEANRQIDGFKYKRNDIQKPQFSNYQNNLNINE